MVRYDDILRRLREAPAAIRCSELTGYLEDLGFEVTSRASGNHKTAIHKENEEVPPIPFDCGHGTDPEIKKCYIRRVIQVLSQNGKYWTERQEK